MSRFGTTNRINKGGISPEICLSVSTACAHIHNCRAAIACLVSDNRWLDIIKLISVIKEVPLPKLGHAGILLAGDRSSVSFTTLHFNSVIISSRYLATY